MATEQPQHLDSMEQDNEADISMAELLRSLKQPQSNILSMDEWQAQHAPRIMAPNNTAAMSMARQHSNPMAVTQFHDLCNRSALVPVFSYVERSQSAFACSVECGEIFKLSLSELFTTKKAAKHYICERALPQLAELICINAQSVMKSPSSTFRDQNWLLLLEMYLPPARVESGIVEYSETFEEIPGEALTVIDSGQQFWYKAIVRLSLFPNRIFGSTTNGFPSKNAAKQNAAKEAVMFLRENNCNNAVANTQLNVAQRVQQKAHVLGLQNPAWVEKPSRSPDGTSVVAWWEMAGRFLPSDAAKHPRLNGDVGLVGPIHGRQNAKTACAKAVLEILEQIEQEWSSGP